MAKNEIYTVISGKGDQELSHWCTDTLDGVSSIIEKQENRGLWAMVFDQDSYFTLWPEQKLRQGKIVEEFKRKYL